MAEIYKVWDVQRVIHLAAKVLHKDMALDKIFLRRFKHEADTLTLSFCSLDNGFYYTPPSRRFCFCRDRELCSC